MEKNHKKKRRGITLVLSGGSAKGLAHIGVIEELEKAKIPIKRIIGTSAGALVGGFYAAGKLKELKELFLGLTKWDAFKIFFSFPTYNSLINCKKIDSLLEKYLKNIKIQDLKIPFIAVAFDIYKEEKVLFSKGSLFEAIRSSISIPGFFKPFKIKDSLFIDGGIVDVVPVDIAKKYNDPILAVNLESQPFFQKNKLNVLKIFDYASYLGTRELARMQEQGADLVFHPETNAGHFEFYKAKQIINSGRRITRKNISKIKRLIK